MMSKKFVAPIIGASFLMLGLSMPSCPGQQAIQQQIDALKAGETEAKTRMASLEGQVKSLKEELDQSKGLLAQVSTSVAENVKALEEMRAAQKSAAAQPKGAQKTSAVQTKAAKTKKK